MAERDAEILERETGRLARLLQTEITNAFVELGHMQPHAIRPWDELPAADQEVYTVTARNIYLRLGYHTGQAYVMVIDHSMRAPDGQV